MSATPYYEDAKHGITIYHGDCREIMPNLTGFDAIVTDPPYGTGGWRRDDGGRGSNPSGAIGIEIEERYCEIAARRLDGTGVLPFGPSEVHVQQEIRP